MNLNHVTKFPPYFPFTLCCFYTKISSLMPVSTIGIVRGCFYLFIFYFEKFSAWVWLLPLAVNVNLNLSNVNMSYPRSRNRRTSTPYLKVCLCWKVYFRGLTIKDTQVGLHCSGTCLSLFQCCFVMIFRWNCPSSRPTLKGTEKRRSSTTCERYSFNWPNVMDCRFHSFSLGRGWGGGMPQAT